MFICQSESSNNQRSRLYTATGYNTILGTFDKQRFVLRGHMEKGCKPILKAQFFPGMINKDTMLFIKAPSLPVGEKILNNKTGFNWFQDRDIEFFPPTLD